ncbi:MAG: amino acid permease [Acidobacteriaceae bacterium]
MLTRPIAVRPQPGEAVQPQLRRILGMGDMVLLIVGTVIGSGIFLVPGAVLRPLGNSVPLAMTVWLMGGVLSLLGALTYGELTAMKPQAGGIYVYIRDCFGPLPAFLFGWTLFFVISTGSIATLAVAFSNYLAEFLPLTPVTAKLVSVLVIAVICVVNVRGVRGSANLQNITTSVKVLAILLMGTALLWLGKSFALLPATPQHLSTGSLASGFGLAMISVLWAYEGWQYATYSAGETINPQRTFPLAFLIGSATLIGLYLFANLAYVAALGPDGVAASNRVAASAVSTIIGPAAARFVAAAILVSMFSAANSIVLTAPRVYYAMAKDGVFFKRLSEVHPRFGTPAFAIAAATLWAAILAASGTFEQLLTYVVFIGWIFYALAAASVFVYRKHDPGAHRPYRVPGYPFTPAIFIVAAVALVVNTMATQPARAAIGLGIVALGTPAYFLWKRGAESR